MNRKDITSLRYDQLEQEMKLLGQPAFRGGQVFSWLHDKKVTSFSEMTNLPKDLRATLEDTYFITALTVNRKQVSKLDGTTKYLYQLADGNAIETVVMKYHHGTSLCVSTQVGCRMGCQFCASTVGGRVRNLTPAEILAQVYATERNEATRIDSIVLMGIGEPLDNFENVISFLQIISHPKGKDMSLRAITLSTCGVVDKIYELAEYGFPITLSISLHSVSDEKRSRIMPVNRRWNIEELLDASRAYFEKTKRRITYEYALIQGENDSPAEANALAQLLRGQNCHVNLIPINPVVSKAYRPSGDSSVRAFQQTLERRGIPATIRRELGSDISAACGQLRHEESH